MLGIFLVSLLDWSGFVTANVVLIGRNTSLSFDDVEANFGKHFCLGIICVYRLIKSFLDQGSGELLD